MDAKISFRDFKPKDVKPTRGWRNNNPLNIRYEPSNHWLGKVKAKERKDKFFEEFEDIFHGYRAAILLLMKYYYVYHLRTPMKIVSRWAPPNENDSKQYALTVMKQVHTRSTNAPNCRYDTMTINDPMPSPERSIYFWIWFIEGMTLMESGKMPCDLYDNATMRGMIGSAMVSVLCSSTFKAWRKQYGE